MGNGTRISSDRPVQIQNIDHAIEIAATAFHTLALLDNGTVMAWGHNEAGQLGDGITLTRESPVIVRGLPDTLVVSISGGDQYSAALLANGTVWSWGRNNWKESGTQNPELSPRTFETGNEQFSRSP